MGYDSLFIGRISDFDKERRKNAKELEMVWLTSEKNLGKWRENTLSCKNIDEM